jgi:hypothetical protein
MFIIKLTLACWFFRRNPKKIFSGPHMKGVIMSICTLTRSENYIETLSICPVDALPGSFSLMIQSQLLSARAPSALHVQHRVVVPTSALQELHAAIGKCLDEAARNRHKRRFDKDSAHAAAV